jgi:endoglucanase
MRHLMVPTHAANPSTMTINDLVVPNDDPRIIVSLHTYYPFEFSMEDDSTWGSDSDRSEMEEELDRIYDLLPANGRAVVIGEWGAINKNNTGDRVDHAETYARLVRERGMCPIWWDNGAPSPGADGFGLLARDESPPGWDFPDIAAALADGADDGAGL